VIVNWLMMLAQGFVTGLMAIVPNWAVPPALLNLDDQVSTLLNSVSGLGAWVNWPVAITLCFIPLTLWASGLVFKIGVWAWSKVPLIGSK
jgi:hypothetical protein